MDRWKDGSMNATMHESVIRWDQCLDEWGKGSMGGGGQGSSKKVDEFKK